MPRQKTESKRSIEVWLNSTLSLILKIRRFFDFLNSKLLISTTN